MPAETIARAGALSDAPDEDDIRQSAKRYRRASAAALSSPNMRGETETPTPSNCGLRSGNCNP